MELSNDLYTYCVDAGPKRKILAALFSVATYVLVFVVLAAPIIALLRIAENTRIIAEQS